MRLISKSTLYDIKLFYRWGLYGGRKLDKWALSKHRRCLIKIIFGGGSTDERKRNYSYEEKNVT